MLMPPMAFRPDLPNVIQRYRAFYAGHDQPCLLHVGAPLDVSVTWPNLMDYPLPGGSEGVDCHGARRPGREHQRRSLVSLRKDSVSKEGYHRSLQQGLFRCSSRLQRRHDCRIRVWLCEFIGRMTALLCQF